MNCGAHFAPLLVLRSAVGMTHSLRSDLWWTIPFHVLLDHFWDTYRIPHDQVNSEIDQIHLSIEAQCVSHYYPRWTATILLLVSHRFFFFFLKSWCHTKRRTGAATLLVWQRLRTLGTFLRNAAQLYHYHFWSYEDHDKFTARAHILLNWQTNNNYTV